MANVEVMQFQKLLADRAQAGPSRDLKEVASLKTILGDLTITFKKTKNELLQLRIQMTC